MMHTVKQEIFLRRKFSRISADLPKFPVVNMKLVYPPIREIFLPQNCLTPEFAEFSCLELCCIAAVHFIGTVH